MAFWRMIDENMMNADNRNYLLFADPFLAPPIVQEDHVGIMQAIANQDARRRAKAIQIRSLLDFMGQNETITAAALRWEAVDLFDPYDGFLFELEVKKWQEGFELYQAPISIQDNITTTLLNCHLQILNGTRDGYGIDLIYSRVLRQMGPNETIKKTVARLRKEAQTEFNRCIFKYREERILSVHEAILGMKRFFSSWPMFLIFRF
ncbi:hypothetical protein CASFOL_023086 [Castilleja foliolosa]|uniref:Uncharacterized protein n=1 Tax=Castilleja foliolosa TaxID=1961234 RepID=A0ABD3CKI4_9LAMI